MVNKYQEGERTLEEKKKLAELLQNQVEIEAIISGGRTGGHLEGHIRHEGNIMPEYLEEREADIVIGLERRRIKLIAQKNIEEGITLVEGIVNLKNMNFINEVISTLKDLESVPYSMVIEPNSEGFLGVVFRYLNENIIIRFLEGKIIVEDNKSIPRGLQKFL